VAYITDVIVAISEYLFRRKLYDRLTILCEMTQDSLIYRTEPATKKWKTEELNVKIGYAQKYR